MLNITGLTHQTLHEFVRIRKKGDSNGHSEVLHMDNQRHIPHSGGDESKFSTSATQSEHNSEVRGESRDPVITTKDRMEDNSDVPYKVPRFQYVDFPSLYQCIKQLSVPTMEGWLASSPPRMVTAHHHSSPKEKVPKFKYVDYPSLYHCIQQLSLPPLETWSLKLTKPSPGGLHTDTVGVQCPSQIIRDRKNNKEKKENRVSGSTVHVPIPDQAVHQHMNDTQLSLTLEKESKSQRDSNIQQMHSGFSSDFISSSGSNQEQDKTSERNEKNLRPSVISLVHTERQKDRVQPEKQPERGKPPAQLKQPLGQQIFTYPVQR